MNKTQLNAEIQTLKNLYARLNEVKEVIQAHETKLKDYMTDNAIELLTLTAGTVSYKEIVSRTLNTTELKKSEFAFIYDKFLNEKTSMRFKVA